MAVAERIRARTSSEKAAAVALNWPDINAGEVGPIIFARQAEILAAQIEDARRAVDEFLASQQKRGRRCVLLVTGKGKNSPGGEGVLRERVPEWLARGPSSRRVPAFASARACDGVRRLPYWGPAIFPMHWCILPLYVPGAVLRR